MKQLLTPTLACLIFIFTAFGVAIAQNVPIDFEPTGNGASWNWTVFENDLNPPLEIVANPHPGGINGSATVAKFTALQAGMPFAGCESLHGAGIGSFTIDSTNMIIKIMVWKSVISDVGIKLVRFDNWSLGEIKIANTVTNEWELIAFDFSSHMGNVYDQIVIFPDFNSRTSDNIIYFDNILGLDSIPLATSIVEREKMDFKLFPNPGASQCKIQSAYPIEHVKVFDMLGELKLELQSPAQEISLDVSGFANGVYIVEAQIEGEIFRRRLLKR